jgi:hypothetical protein
MVKKEQLAALMTCLNTIEAQINALISKIKG